MDDRKTSWLPTLLVIAAWMLVLFVVYMVGCTQAPLRAATVEPQVIAVDAAAWERFNADWVEVQR